MGQAMAKRSLAKDKEILRPIVEGCYEEHFRKHSEGKWSLDEFYRLVCKIVEEINKKLGGTQFFPPSEATLEKAFKKIGRKPTKEEFGTILKEVLPDMGFNGGGAKDILLYIFGIPLTSVFIKDRFAPTLIPNDIFIPAVTSATVVILAKLNKI